MRSFLCSALFACLANILSGQNSISGKVTDAANGMAIPFAGVYVPELNTGCTAAADGLFILKNVPKGVFTIQVSRLGYRSISVKLNVQDSLTSVTVTLTGLLVNAPEVTVYGENDNEKREVIKTTEKISSQTMKEDGALSLSDGLTRIAGVNQITSGSGISKPVIRGLTGNRVQSLVLGIRFDNQNWGEEHGLGLSYLGIEKVEVIKGPYSLLYGSEAMGGVINIQEENPAAAGTLQSDAGVGLFSNTLGYSATACVKKNSGKINWRVRIGNESHADYQDGNNMRVINSRFTDYIGKASLNFIRKNWVSKNNYFFALNNYGFVGEIYDVLHLNENPDARMSRDLYYPHHQVFINMFSSQNSIFLKTSTIKFILGAHFNNRQEQELGYFTALDMQLNTYNGSFLWEKRFGEDFTLTLGTQHLAQTNQNLAVRNVIPDANLFENSAYTYMKLELDKWFFDAGARFDTKNIQTFYTPNKYAPSTDIGPINNFYTAASGSLGASRQLGKYFLLKANGSNAFRAPNLAELSSNGLHEGTLRYEIGNTNLKLEQMFGSEASIQVNSQELTGYAAVFYNYFQNYIFLAPTTEQYIGLPIYRYMQQDAVMQGIDASISYNPKFLKWLTWNQNYAMVQGTRNDGVNLPFIPPPKFTSELRSDLRINEQSFFIKGSATYIMEQKQLAMFEKYTPSYSLINAGIGAVLTKGKCEYTLSVTCNNLLNTVYYDHLSRYKYFVANGNPVYNMGRNLVINLAIKFTKSLKHENSNGH